MNCHYMLVYFLYILINKYNIIYIQRKTFEVFQKQVFTYISQFQ
jgi:hypothetical protein